MPGQSLTVGQCNCFGQRGHEEVLDDGILSLQEAVGLSGAILAMLGVTRPVGRSGALVVAVAGHTISETDRY